MGQIMKAIGMNVGTEDLEIVRASSNNNISDTNGNIKIEIEHKEGRTFSIVQGVALQPQPGLVVQVDEASLKIDIDEDLWKEEFYENSREEKFDKDPSQEVI